MYIEKITINNFRGINIEVNDLRNEFLIIGKNDSGKSNFCYAIRKLFDYNIRKEPLIKSDSTNSNGDDIFISVRLNIDNISPSNRSIISKHIDEENGKEYLKISLKCQYDSDTLHYNEKIILGEKDCEEKATNASLVIDKTINLVYINPNYNLNKDEKEFFKYNQIKMENEGLFLSDTIIDNVKELNDSICSDQHMIEISEELNSNEKFNEIFENVSFKISSNIEIANAYKSLRVIPVSNDESEVLIGDGKSKTLSLLLQKMINSTSKETIYIIEEPENHMYPLLQKQFSELMNSFNVGQIIYTSHSPYIVDLKKMKQIIKLTRLQDNSVQYYSLNIAENDYKKFGYLLNEEIAQMFFCDNVLLVEGFSEKIFYNLLYLEDEKFKKYVNKKSFGIFCVGGIDFQPAKTLLEKLGITVYIKTDNDKYGVDKKMQQMHYAGLERCINCLSMESKAQIKSLLNISEITKDTFRYDSSLNGLEIVENNMEKITNIFYENKIILSNHFDGFERDFLEFIKSKNIDCDMKYLKKSKMKNLYKYIEDEKIHLSINDENKYNVLIRFMYE